MSDQTKIEWADMPLLKGSPEFQTILVNRYVACPTKCNAVSNVRPQFWMLSKRPDMVGVEVPTAIISTQDACEFVSQFDVVSPPLDLNRNSEISPLSAFPIDVTGRFRATDGCNPQGATDLSFCFYRPRDAFKFAWSTLFRCRHFCLGFLGVGAPAKGRRLSIGSFSHLDVGAFKTLRGCKIVTRCIFCKLASWHPLLAFRALLKAIADQALKFFNAQSCLFCSNFQRTGGGLSHG